MPDHSRNIAISASAALRCSNRNGPRLLADSLQKQEESRGHALAGRGASVASLPSAGGTARPCSHRRVNAAVLEPLATVRHAVYLRVSFAEDASRSVEDASWVMNSRLPLAFRTPASEPFIARKIAGRHGSTSRP